MNSEIKIFKYFSTSSWFFLFCFCFLFFRVRMEWIQLTPFHFWYFSSCFSLVFWIKKNHTSCSCLPFPSFRTFRQFFRHFCVFFFLSHKHFPPDGGDEYEYGFFLISKLKRNHTFSSPSLPSFSSKWWMKKKHFSMKQNKCHK